MNDFWITMLICGISHSISMSIGFYLGYKSAKREEK